MYHGVVLINKPTGTPARPLLNRMLRALPKKQKAGWCGTLDPLATGMLPVCLGEATKIAPWIVSGQKKYTTEAQLGITTDTGDADGNLTQEIPLNAMPSETAIQNVLKDFVGEIEQIPPMVSAIKHKGKPLYQWAREGTTIERKPRACTIASIRLIQVDAKQQRLTLSVVCSKGTYIRTLVEAIGARLGCGAHVARLHRDWVAPFQDHPMVAPDDWLGHVNPASFILTPQAALPHLPCITLDQALSEAFCQGKVWPMDADEEGPHVILSLSGIMLGIGIIDSGKIKPKKVFNL